MMTIIGMSAAAVGITLAWLVGRNSVTYRDVDHTSITLDNLQSRILHKVTGITVYLRGSGWQLQRIQFERVELDSDHGTSMTPQEVAEWN